MPVQIFSLRHVPDDEVQEVRELLEQHNIDFYETEPGNWGISGGAFWLRSDEHLVEAKKLINTYQQSRAEKARLEYESLKSQGKQRRFSDVVRENPLQLVFYIAAILFVLYFSIKPFLGLGS